MREREREKKEGKKKVAKVVNFCSALVYLLPASLA